MNKQFIAIEKLSSDEVDNLINEFKTCGWKYLGTTNFVNVHTFANFLWDKEEEPIYPKGHEQQKDLNPIQVQDVL